MTATDRTIARGDIIEEKGVLQLARAITIPLEYELEKTQEVLVELPEKIQLTR